MIKRAAEVMSGKLIHIGWEAPIKRAFEVMQERRIRHLPVVDNESKVIGILSDRDVQRAMKAELVWNDELQAKVPDYERVVFDPDAEVRHYMSWPVNSVDRGADLRVVTGVMVTNKISSVLVTEGDRFVGIVTTEDLLKVLMGLLGDPPVRKALRLDSILGITTASDLSVRSPAREVMNGSFVTGVLSRFPS